MSHRTARYNRQNRDQIVAAGPQAQSLAQGDHEVEDGIEEDGNRQQKPAAEKGNRSSLLAQQTESRSDESIRRPTLEHTHPDDGGHCDDNPYLTGRAAKSGGYPLPNRLAHQLLDLFGIQALFDPVALEGVGWRQDRYRKSAKQKGQKGVHPHQQDAQDYNRHSS